MPTPGEPAETGKLSLFYKRRETKITRAEVVIIFLALIRTITAYYQLKTRPGNILPAGQVEPIITGSLVAVLFCLALTLLSFSGRYRVMHAVFALAIISLVLQRSSCSPDNTGRTGRKVSAAGSWSCGMGRLRVRLARSMPG